MSGLNRRAGDFDGMRLGVEDELVFALVVDLEDAVLLYSRVIGQ